MTQNNEAKVEIEVPGGKGTLHAKAKVFSTGSTGFYAQGKVEGKDGKRYQVSVQLVLIGSKPKA